MNYRYLQFYVIKFFPSAILFIEFEDLVLKSIELPTESYMEILILLLLLTLQYISFKIQYVSIFIDRFEILGWYKYDIKNWDETKSLQVLRSYNLNIGKIKFKNEKKIYFISYINLSGYSLFKKKDSLSSHYDLIDKIKSIYYI